MGRKTLESIGRPLPYRQNIVVTRQDLEFEGTDVVHSLAHAYAKAEHDVYVIGGAEIYKQALQDVDIIYATEIHTVMGGDIVFPILSDEWHEVAREDHSADHRNKVDYSFVTYAKRQSGL